MTSSPRGARSWGPNIRVCLRLGGTEGSVACDARKWRFWPASASSTTHGWSGAQPQACPESVLDGVASALQLDDAERPHLITSSAQRRLRTGRLGAARPARPSARALQRVLDSMTAPAYIRNGLSDILAANALGRALYAPIFDMGDASQHGPVRLPQPCRTGLLH